MVENYDFIGKNIKEVEQFYNLNFRVASKNGEFFVLTRDFNPERFNFNLENDVIVSFTKG